MDNPQTKYKCSKCELFCTDGKLVDLDGNYVMLCRKCSKKLDEGPKPLEIDYEENSDLKPYNSEPILCCCSCFGLFKWKKKTELKPKKK